jgi:aminopeptidase
MLSKAYILPFDPKAPGATLVADPSKLWPTAAGSGDIKPPKVATARVFFNADGNGTTTSLSSLGKEFSTRNLNDGREAVRQAVGGAVKALRDLPEVKEVEVDVSAVDPHAAAVGAHLALYKFTLKTPDSRFNPNLTKPIPEKIVFTASTPSKEWDLGVVYAQAQNQARTWAELPANMCTPTIFCNQVKELMSGLKNVEVIIRDEAWAAEKGMNTFLSVTHGTSEPAKFLEV